MKRSQLINEAYSIMIRNKALWIVTLISLAIYTLSSVFFSGKSLQFAIVGMLINFAVYAFLPGALIKMVDSIAERQITTAKDGFEAGARHFIRLLGVELILMLPVWILLVVITGSFVSIFSQYGQPGGIQGANAVTYIPAMFGALGLILLLSLISSAITVGANRAIVLEGHGIIEALKHGVRLLIDQFGDYFVIGFLLLIVSVAFSLFIGCSTISAAMLVGIGQADFSMTADSLESFESNPYSNIPLFIMMILLSLLIQSVIRILFSGTWTLAFRQWQGKETIVPKDQPEITIVE